MSDPLDDFSSIPVSMVLGLTPNDSGAPDWAMGLVLSAFEENVVYGVVPGTAAAEKAAECGSRLAWAKFLRRHGLRLMSEAEVENYKREHRQVHAPGDGPWAVLDSQHARNAHRE